MDGSANQLHRISPTGSDAARTPASTPGNLYEVHDSKRTQTVQTAAPSSAASTLYVCGSTREPSRESPPSRSTARDTLTSNPALGPAEEVYDEDRTRCERRRKPSFISQERRVVIDSIDAELAELRPRLQEQTQKVARLKDEIKAAKEREQRAARERRINAVQTRDRRRKLTTKLQSVVRGWLVRKRVIEALDHRTVHSMKMAAMLPDLLKDQLKQLQHDVHDLKYRPEHRVAPAVRIQAWWRGTVARRVVKVMRLAQKLKIIGLEMSGAATIIQALFRGSSIKRKFRSKIQQRMALTSQRQYREMELAMYCIIHIQQSYRAKLARRKLTDLLDDATSEETHARASQKLSEASVDDPNQKIIVDTWLPATAAGAEAAGPGRAGVIIEKPPRHDWELDKIENAGHVLFYGTSSEERLRHKIGGATALLMQQQLGIGRSRDDEPIEDTPSNDVAAISDVSALKEVLGDPWNVYPEGLTPGFVSGLSRDVWEKGGRAKSYENSLKLRGLDTRKRKKSKPSGPRPCTKIVSEPPCNATLRARKRDEASIEKDCIDTLALASAEAHPLFVNAPPLPRCKERPGRSARFFRPALADAQEEGAWDVVSVQQPAEHRQLRRPRKCGEDLQQELWNTLNVPYLGPRHESYVDKLRGNGFVMGDPHPLLQQCWTPSLAVERGRVAIEEGKKRTPEEVDHERVWSIANALAGQISEKLPVLSAG